MAGTPAGTTTGTPVGTTTETTTETTTGTTTETTTGTESGTKSDESIIHHGVEPVHDSNRQVGQRIGTPVGAEPAKS
jgi:hypothetical protein